LGITPAAYFAIEIVSTLILRLKQITRMCSSANPHLHGILTILRIMKRIIYNLVAAAIVMFVLMMVPKIQPNVAATPKTAAQLYSRYCVSCHGRNGRSQTSKGKFSHARDLTDANWQDDVTDERIFNSIMNGRNVRGNMPGFKDKLNEKDVESLIGMVRGFRK